LPVDSTPYALAVAAGDVDLDGDLDLVFGTYRDVPGGQNRLYLNNGTGLFADATARRMQAYDASTHAVALGDIDGDGDLDVIFGNGGSSLPRQNQLNLNDGTGVFIQPLFPRLPSDNDDTRAVVLGDLDRDGDLDVIFGNHGQNRVHFNNGVGKYTVPPVGGLLAGSDNTEDLALGDVDRDGFLDLVCGSQPQYRLYLNDGTGRYADATPARMSVDSDYSQAVALGDVDGDGDLDIVFANNLQNRLYVNDGLGRYMDATAARMPADTDFTYAVALRDADGDGDLDVILANQTIPSRFYLNDGAGRFLDATAVRMLARDTARAAALGDVDGDGDLDVVFGNRYSTDRLYLNLLRQLDAPVLARPGYTYTLEVYSRYGPPSGLEAALPFLSPAAAQIPVPPFGTFGLDPTPMLALPPFVVPQPAGVGSLSFSVPSLPGLAGVPLYAHALVYAAPPAPTRLTSVMADVIVQ